MNGKRFFVLVLVASGAALALPLPPALRIACAFLQTYYVPGFVFLRFLGDRNRPRLDELFLPLLLSPVLIAACVLGAHRVTGDLNGAIETSLILSNLLLLVSLFGSRNERTGPEGEIPPWILAVSAGAAGVVAAAYIVNDYLLVYTDAWHHASVTFEILDRGIPPLEPRFPDVPIHYMWIYHLFHAVYLRLSGLSVFTVLGVFNVVTAFIFPYLVARLAGLFTRARRHLIAAPLLAFSGLQSAGWVLWPLAFLRPFFGQVRGTDEIARILAHIELNGAGVIYFLTPPLTWLMSMMDKFLTITAMQHALNLFLLFFLVALERRFHDRSPVRAASTLFVAAIGSFLSHVVIGLSLILTAVGAPILVHATGRLLRRPRPSAFQSFVVPGVALCALLAGYPYFSSLTGGAGGGMIRQHLHFGYTNLLTIIAPLVVLLPFSARAVKDLIIAGSGGTRTLAAWIAVLFVIALCAELPGIAENKIIFPLFTLLALPVSRRIADSLAAGGGARRLLLTLWILLLFLVPPVLTVRGFMLEKPRTPRFEKRYHITGAERQLYRWLRDNTAPDAVVIEKNTYNLVPVYARRRNFILQPVFIRVHDYRGDKVERYVAIHRNLFSDKPISGETVRALRAMPMDFYVVLWREELAEDPALGGRFASHPEWFEEKFENAAGIVYRLRKDYEQPPALQPLGGGPARRRRQEEVQR